MSDLQKGGGAPPADISSLETDMDAVFLNDGNPVPLEPKASILKTPSSDLIQYNSEPMLANAPPLQPTVLPGPEGPFTCFLPPNVPPSWVAGTFDQAINQVPDQTHIRHRDRTRSRSRGSRSRRRSESRNSRGSRAESLRRPERPASVISAISTNYDADFSLVDEINNKMAELANLRDALPDYLQKKYDLDNNSNRLVSMASKVNKSDNYLRKLEDERNRFKQENTAEKILEQLTAENAHQSKIQNLLFSDDTSDIPDPKLPRFDDVDWPKKPASDKLEESEAKKVKETQRLMDSKYPKALTWNSDPHQWYDFFVFLKRQHDRRNFTQDAIRTLIEYKLDNTTIQNFEISMEESSTFKDGLNNFIESYAVNPLKDRTMRFPRDISGDKFRRYSASLAHKFKEHLSHIEDPKVKAALVDQALIDAAPDCTRDYINRAIIDRYDKIKFGMNVAPYTGITLSNLIRKLVVKHCDDSHDHRGVVSATLSGYAYPKEAQNKKKNPNQKPNKGKLNSSSIWQIEADQYNTTRPAQYKNHSNEQPRSVAYTQNANPPRRDNQGQQRNYSNNRQQNNQNGNGDIRVIHINEVDKINKFVNEFVKKYPIHNASAFNTHIQTITKRAAERFPSVKEVKLDPNQTPRVQMKENGFYVCNSPPIDFDIFLERGKGQLFTVKLLEYFNDKCWKCGLTDCNPASLKCPMRKAPSGFAPCQVCKRALHGDKACKVYLGPSA